MNTPNGRMKMIAWAGGIVIVVIVVVLVVINANSGATPSAQNTANGTSTEPVASSTVTTAAAGATVGTGAAGTGNTTAGANVPTRPAPAIVIHLLTPTSNSAWTIGGTNSIAWDKAAGVTGEVDLVNASTHAFIGVILSETGPNQTSYSWDAREIYLTRYGADKKDVTPGVYAVRIHFDGNGLGDLVSAPITIAN